MILGLASTIIFRIHTLRKSNVAVVGNKKQSFHLESLCSAGRTEHARHAEREEAFCPQLQQQLLPDDAGASTVSKSHFCHWKLKKNNWNAEGLPILNGPL